MNSPLHIALLPLDIAWADRDANLRAVEEAAASLPNGVDLLVLPELFSTGFIADPDVYPAMAETDSGITMSTLKILAHKHNFAIAGSYLSCNADRTAYYNRAFFIEPNGDSSFVNKRHLFHVSPEAQLLTPGHTSYAVVRFRGWNIALGVCYDLRFPVWCRNTIVKGRMAYDLFLLPCNWPEVRGFALKTLSSARAIENQAYVVTANRSGSDEYGEYDGLTFAHDFVGAEIASSDTDNPAAPIFFTADREALSKLREYMPASLDSDKFTINY